MSTARRQPRRGRAFAGPAAAARRLFTVAHTVVYRATGGSLGAKIGKTPMLLLRTTGRKTGKQRTSPLGYLADGDNLVVVGSNLGAPDDPAWVHNLRRTPHAEVEVGRRTLPVTAEEARAEEKRRLWSLLTRMFPGYDDHQKRTTREIPVFVLRPRAGA